MALVTLLMSFAPQLISSPAERMSGHFRAEGDRTLGREDDLLTGRPSRHHQR